MSIDMAKRSAIGGPTWREVECEVRTDRGEKQRGWGKTEPQDPACYPKEPKESKTPKEPKDPKSNKESSGIPSSTTGTIYLAVDDDDWCHTYPWKPKEPKVPKIHLPPNEPDTPKPYREPNEPKEHKEPKSRKVPSMWNLLFCKEFLSMQVILRKRIRMLFKKLLITTLLMSALLASSLHATTPKERLKEIEYIEKIITTKWSNKEIHEKQDGINIHKILNTLKKHIDGSNEDYLASMEETLKLFHDPHLDIFLPVGFEDQSYHSGLHVAHVSEGYALVKCEKPADCSHLPLPLLITQVDNLPIEIWLRRRADKLNGSTKLRRRNGAMNNLGWYSFVRKNPPAKTITLLLPNGKTKMLPLNWQKYVWWDKEAGKPEPRCIESKLDPSGTFILIVKTFHCGLPEDHKDKDGYYRFLKHLKTALKKAKGTDSLIMDIRENSGGKLTIAEIALQLLVDQKIHFFTESFLNKDGTWGAPEKCMAEPNMSLRKYFKNRPAGILSGPECGSTCSYFVVAAKTADIAMILGEPASGSNGGAKHYRLPASGALLSVPWDKSWAADGQLIEGRTIEVNKKIIPSIKDYKSDPDPILTKSIQILRKEKFKDNQT
ncbi:MAG: hypothetical protein HY877_08180 [Deltaproteobacteria bacterium]|nr:hypothetical protein [Deltaproteobacteria bacterium]